MSVDIAVLVGSLRAGSVNRELAETLRDRAPDGITLDIVEGLEDVPFYNQDLDGDAVPEAAAALRERIASADRVLVITPEYNGTLPAVVSNAIDWLSRPHGQGALVGKPLAAIGTTPTPYGGKWAHEATLRSARIAGADVRAALAASQSGTDVDVLHDEETLKRFDQVIEGLAAADQELVA